MATLDGLDPRVLARRTRQLLIFVLAAAAVALAGSCYWTWHFLTSHPFHAIPIIGDL